MTCEHVWAEITDLPIGEPKGRYWKCSRCDVIGYTRRPKSAEKARPVIYRCCQLGCTESATLRRPGRGTRGRLLWVCPEHGR